MDWEGFLGALWGILKRSKIGVAVRFRANGSKTVIFKRPVDPKIPVAARYGAKGPWWNWHVDENGKWRQGRVNGMGQHKGIDFASPIGTPVYVMVDGTIEAASWENPEDAKQGFGLRIRQTYQYDDTVWRAYYGHLSQLRIKPGDFVKAGELIAMSGDSGHATGPHLHVEIRDPMGQQHPIVFEEVKNV